MKLQLWTATVLSSCLMSTVSLGQETSQQIDNPQRQRANVGSQQSNTTLNSNASESADSNKRANGNSNQELISYLAAKLMFANKCQAELASMAADKTENPEVKQFAETLESDHARLNERLYQAMPRLRQVKSPSFMSHSSERDASGSNFGAQTQSALDPQDRNKFDKDQQNNRGERGSQSSQTSPGNQEDVLDGPAQTLVDITRRAVENNHQRTVEMLKQKQQGEFDRCFVASQIGFHNWLVSELEAMRDVGPQQFTTIIQDAERKVESHLEKATQLADKMESENSKTARSKNSDEQTKISSRLPESSDNK